MPRTAVKALILAALFAGAAAAPAMAGGPVVVNATQARDDHANHDRWARSEKKAADENKKPDGDAEQTDDQDAKKDAVPPQHRGELNGKLHLGEW